MSREMWAKCMYGDMEEEYKDLNDKPKNDSGIDGKNQ